MQQIEPRVQKGKRKAKRMELKDTEKDYSKPLKPNEGTPAEFTWLDFKTCFGLVTLLPFIFPLFKPECLLLLSHTCYTNICWSFGGKSLVTQVQRFLNIVPQNALNTKTPPKWARELRWWDLDEKIWTWADLVMGFFLGT